MNRYFADENSRYRTIAQRLGVSHRTIRLVTRKSTIMSYVRGKELLAVTSSRRFLRPPPQRTTCSFALSIKYRKAASNSPKNARLKGGKEILLETTPDLVPKRTVDVCEFDWKR
ncbi:hypothetical protein MTP99_002521 [Tenebrio molitor]|jgi:hypothetical protein|nr:hypothetical protein MTP99_002521 [Tenebrio molitor]